MYTAESLRNSSNCGVCCRLRQRARTKTQLASTAIKRTCCLLFIARYTSQAWRVLVCSQFNTFIRSITRRNSPTVLQTYGPLRRKKWLLFLLFSCDRASCYYGSRFDPRREIWSTESPSRPGKEDVRILSIVRVLLPCERMSRNTKDKVKPVRAIKTHRGS